MRIDEMIDVLDKAKNLIQDEEFQCKLANIQLFLLRIKELVH